MKKTRDEADVYVQKVREGTRRYAHELLSQNEKLRVLLASLEGEKVRLEGKARMVDEVLTSNEALRAQTASLEREKLRLQEELLRVREELEHHRQEHERLQRDLRHIEEESQRLSGTYAEIEQQNSNLANLYVASYRLHATVDRREVLSILQEIVANLIGCEELAVFELDSKTSALSLVTSFGIDPARYGGVSLGAGIIGCVASNGQAFVRDQVDMGAGLPEEADLTACVPLKLDGKITGVLAMFRLLPQKNGFEAVDNELFDLLATHAATALYCSGLHARLGASVAA
jgi:hypothetical protein